MKRMSVNIFWQIKSVAVHIVEMCKEDEGGMFIKPDISPIDCSTHTHEVN